ncbi:hypothetical protein MRX96_015881 [Rhipicephalus microplus]
MGCSSASDHTPNQKLGLPDAGLAQLRELDAPMSHEIQSVEEPKREAVLNSRQHMKHWTLQTSQSQSFWTDFAKTEVHDPREIVAVESSARWEQTLTELPVTQTWLGMLQL